MLGKSETSTRKQKNESSFHVFHFTIMIMTHLRILYHTRKAEEDIGRKVWIKTATMTISVRVNCGMNTIISTDPIKENDDTIDYNIKPKKKTVGKLSLQKCL